MAGRSSDDVRASPSSRSVVSGAKARISIGIGGWTPSTGLLLEMGTTKRCAAAATIRSRVWARSPPLTSHPCFVELIGAVECEVKRAELVESCYSQAHCPCVALRLW